MKEEERERERETDSALITRYPTEEYDTHIIFMENNDNKI